MKYRILHKTGYDYEVDVSLSQHIAHLRPPSNARQRCTEFRLTTKPATALKADHDDYFGNHTTYFSIQGDHRRLEVTARSVVEVMPLELPDGEQTPPWEIVRDRCRSEKKSPAADAGDFTFESPMIPHLPGLLNYATQSFPPGRPILTGAGDLTERIYHDFKFDPKATTVATPMERVLKRRRGVCQDFAHFQIGCFRSLGIPARYVSGYLETSPPPGVARLIGADASHAWVQIFVPDFGWVDLDPTNNAFPTDRHVLVACGRDFDDVSPIRGVMVGGQKHTLTVSVDVAPLTPGKAPKPRAVLSPSGPLE
jgi:transglutaminase-like putative cysteine protease